MREFILFHLLPIGFFLVLTVLIVFPWFFDPGFLFLLDFVWSPSLVPSFGEIESGHISSIPYQILWWFLGMYFPVSFVQKIAFSLPFFLSGISVFYLVKWVLLRAIGSTDTLVPSLIAGMFYMGNQFVVTRVFMGQFYFLLGYSLVPFTLLAVLALIEHPSFMRGIVAGVAALQPMLANAHHMVLVPLVLMTFFPLRNMERYRSTLAGFVLILGIFFIPAILLSLNATQGVYFLDPQGPWARSLKAPFSSNLLLDSLFLTATWKIDLPFLFSYEALPGFTILIVLFCGFMIYGVVYCLRREAYVARLLILSAVSLVFAIGIAHPFTEGISSFFYRFVPGWIGLRDSAKFLSLLALSESVFLGLGVAVFLQSVRLRSYLLSRVVSSGFVAVMVFVLFPMFRGFEGQIKPHNYPASWQEWNNRIANIDPSPRMLFLPWHMYQPFGFTGGITITHPGRGFFSNGEVITGDNSEVGGIAGDHFIYSESKRPLSLVIETILNYAPDRRDFGTRISELGFTYVMLAADTPDAKVFDYLYHQDDLHVVYRGPELVVWEAIEHVTNTSTIL